MAPADRSLPYRRALPINALLPFMLGLLALIVRYRFAEALDLEPPFRIGLSVTGIVLLWWAGRQFYKQMSGQAAARERKTPHRMFLPREGMVFLVIMMVVFVGSIIGGSNMLMLVFSMMAAPFVLNGWLSYSMLTRCQVKRVLPERSMVGEVVSIGLELQNRRRWLSSWLMAVRDRIQTPTETLESGVVFARIPPRDARLAHYQLRPMSRGIVKLGPVEILTRFPFGLVERGLMMQETGRMLVHPRIGKLTARWKQNRDQISELLDRREHQRGVYDDEFNNIREYRFGDNPKAIHWRSSARQQELMVREYEQSRDQHLALILDLWIPERLTRDDAERVELAISFAATVAIEQIRENRMANLSFIANGKNLYHWNLDDTPVTVESLLDLLAVLKPGRDDSLAEAIRQTRAHSPSHTRYVLISTRETPPELTAEDEEGTTHSAMSLLTGVQFLPATWQNLSPFFVLD